MRNLGRFVLGALAAALRNTEVAIRSDFVKALKCVWSLIDFHLMAQCGSHTMSTLDYIESYLEDFHKHKDIFLEFRAYKKTLKDARDRTKAVSGFQSTQRSSEEIQEIQERSHFNFIKLHVVMHYREHVERLGSIPQYSTDVSELAHVQQVKETYRASNKVGAATQILDYGGRRLVPIPIFQKPDIYEVYNIRCTGTSSFRKGKIRKDWAWVSVRPVGSVSGTLTRTSGSSVQGMG